MLSNLTSDRPLEELEDRIRTAPTPTPALVGDVVAQACTRLPTMKRAGKSPGIDRLVEAEAWFDVALALLTVELPVLANPPAGLRRRRMALLSHASAKFADRARRYGRRSPPIIPAGNPRRIH